MAVTKYWKSSSTTWKMNTWATSMVKSCHFQKTSRIGSACSILTRQERVQLSQYSFKVAPLRARLNSLSKTTWPEKSMLWKRTKSSCAFQNLNKMKNFLNLSSEKSSWVSADSMNRKVRRLASNHSIMQSSLSGSIITQVSTKFRSHIWSPSHLAGWSIFIMACGRFFLPRTISL